MPAEIVRDQKDLARTAVEDGEILRELFAIEGVQLRQIVGLNDEPSSLVWPFGEPAIRTRGVGEGFDLRAAVVRGGPAPHAKQAERLVLAAELGIRLEHLLRGELRREGRV